RVKQLIHQASPSYRNGSRDHIRKVSDVHGFWAVSGRLGGIYSGPAESALAPAQRPSRNVDRLRKRPPRLGPPPELRRDALLQLPNEGHEGRGPLFFLLIGVLASLSGQFMRVQCPG